MSTSNGGNCVSSIVSGVVTTVVSIFVRKRIKLQRRIERRRARLRIPLPPPSSGLAADSVIELGSVEEFLDGIMKEKPIRFSPQHLRDCTRNYSETLGSGGFGTVYKGVLPNGAQVAVKVLRGTSDKRVEEQFMAEVGTIGRTYHINLVKLYGFCFDATVKALVYEYMEKGSLEGYLFGKERTVVIEWEKLRDVAVGTAKGVRYLHEECQQKIVHYDIKPGNVLLDANFCPKVADFGLAKLWDREKTHMSMTGGGRGTPGYAAPEMWMPLPVTHKCDVYSYGMLLFEIVGRRRNLEFSVRSESQQWFPSLVWEKYQQGQLESIVSLCGIEEKNREKAETMYRVALWCVQYQPERRPSMSSVVRMLEGDEEIVPPTNPFLHMVSNPAVSSSMISNTPDTVSEKSETAS